MSVSPAASRPNLRPDLAVGLLTVLALALVAAPVGLVWAAVSPRVAVVIAGDGVDLVNPYTKAFIGGDATFAIVSVVAGAACGAVAFAWGRRFSVGVVCGLGAGGLLAAYIASRVGRALYFGAFQAIAQHARIGTHFYAYTALRAEAALVVWPIAALVVYGLLLLATGERRG